MNKNLTKNDFFPVPSLKDIFKSIPLIFLLYLYIFQPPVLSKYIFIGTEIGICIFYLIFTKQRFLSKYFSIFRRELEILTVLMIYCILRDLFKGAEVLSIRFLAWSFQSFIFSFFIIEIVHRFNFKYEKVKLDIFNCIFWACFIASILTILLITFPQLDNFYKGIQQDEYYDIYENFEQRYRAYGISENITFTYSFVLGFFSGYSIVLLKRKPLLVVPIITFFIGVVYNARIGFLGLGLFLVYLLFLKREFKSLIVLLLILTSLFFSISLIAPNLLQSAFANKEWAFQFFYEISNALFGTHFNVDVGDSLGVLLNDFIIFPKSLFGWIFGTGVNLFEMPRGQNSDIGYIIQLNYGGLILLFLLLLLTLLCTIKLFRTKHYKWYGFIFLLSIIFLNFKGFVFAATPGGRLLFFLFILFVLKDRFKENILI